MSNRTLTWNALSADGNKLSIGATYYIDAEYEPIAVRIYAEKAPDVEDAEFNIYDDGVTIFADRSSPTFYITGGVETVADPVTNLVLEKGENSNDAAQDFLESLELVKGSWISCNLIKDGGGRNFSIHLELTEV